MSLDGALSIAGTGIAAINAELALVSQNIANAGTAGYVSQTSAEQAISAGGQPMGVQALPATLNLNAALQTALFSQTSSVASLTTQQTALQQIDATIGTPAAGNDLATRLGAVQDSLTTLLADPANATQQSAVVASAQALTQQLNTLGTAVQSARQTAQDSIVSGVTSLNQALATVGQLNTKIIGQAATGQSTAALQNTRNAAMATISNLIDAQFVTQSNGEITVLASGTTLPTDGVLTLQTTNATMSAQTAAPPAITIDGQDITGALNGGTIGANIALRDTILPTSQAELDEFSQTLASRFAAQGLTLFTNANGTVPAGGGTPSQSGYVGLANTIQVNPQIVANPSLVRDGTTTIAGSATGASSFTPNTSDGPASFPTLITRLLTNALGAQAQSGVDQPAANTTNLGVNGTLSAPFGGTGTLAALATNVTSAQSQQSASVTASLGTETAVQTGLQSQLDSTSGVNIDTQLSTMIALQNAYGANARVIAAVQAMFTTLVQAIS
jgi:flagellar hook-associated protein 1 FlgK